MSKAEELIACLEGEIAKRDEELAACRVAVENCDLFRARIAELEADRDSHQRYVMLTSLLARIHRDGGQYIKQHGMDKAFADADTIVAELYAAPVSEANAQGVVMPQSPHWPADDSHLSDYDRGHLQGRCDMRSEVIRLNAAPVQQVSVPTWMASSRAFADRLYMAGWRDHADAQHSGVAGMYDELLSSSPAAPAADAGHVFYGMDGNHQGNQHMTIQDLVEFYTL